MIGGAAVGAGPGRVNGCVVDDLVGVAVCHGDNKGLLHSTVESGQAGQVESLAGLVDYRAVLNRVGSNWKDVRLILVKAESLD